MSNKEKDKSNPKEDRQPVNQGTEVRYVPVEINPSDENSSEIDLVEILAILWNKRKIIYMTIGVFIVTGLVVSLLSVTEYTSEVKILPESQSQLSLGALGGLAQQFGFSAPVNQSGDEISASLYPSIIHSNIFLRELMELEISIPDHSERISLKEYILNHQNRSIIMMIVNSPVTFKTWLASLFKSDSETRFQMGGAGNDSHQLLRMTDDEWESLRKLRSRIDVTLNNETVQVDIGVQMQDPVAAATVADYIVNNLSDFIIEKRTEKTKRNVEFIEERFEEAKLQFEEAQRNLAEFNDANRGQLTAMARTEEQLLQSQYELAFNLYNSLAERLEEARIQLQEETPVLSIMEPAAVPDRRSAPNRTLIMIVFIILGGLVGIGIVFIQPFWKQLKAEL